MGNTNYYKLVCLKLGDEVGFEVHGRLDVKDGCPYRGYQGIPWCPGCLASEVLEGTLVGISLREYDKLEHRFPDIS